jgi:sulfur carrier protein
MKREKMTIIINGKIQELREGITLEEILKELSLVGKVMAAAVNMNIVKQNDWNSFVLCEGDKLELLDFVGGG